MFVLIPACVPHVGAEQGHIRVINKNTLTLFFFFFFSSKSLLFIFSPLLEIRRFKAEEVAMVTVWSN